ncbi:MAG: tol-pal system protein YbgF [Rickettsiella sp.]|nr:tol-pal system protein YbgF [Rickettsiella sp.]
MKLIKVSIFLLGFGISAVAHAIAPVVDGYNDADEVPTSSAGRNNVTDNPSNNAPSFSQGQRLGILEHQISNLNPLLVEVDDLTQRMQELRGKIDEQEHHLKQLDDQVNRLENQVRSQYQDLEKRFNQKQVNTTTVPIVKANPATMVNNPPHLNNINSKNAVAARTTVTSSTSMPSAAGERDYQAAFQLLKNKQYVAAIEGFENYIKKYPWDINRPNANYFLGQLYLLQGQPEQSIIRFSEFVKKYPQDGRVPDALLQLGLAYFAKGDKTIAMETFEKIIKQYPDSKSAESAKARLQQFQAMISTANMATKNKA